MENGNGHHKNFVFEEFSLEAERQTLRRGGMKIHLAKPPFSVLLFLIENRERVVSREELLDKFRDGREVYDDALQNASARFASHAAIRKNRRASSKLSATAVIISSARCGKPKRAEKKIKTEIQPEISAPGNGLSSESKTVIFKQRNGNQSETSDLKSLIENGGKPPTKSKIKTFR